MSGDAGEDFTLTAQDQQIFKEMTDAAVAESADELLAKHLDRVTYWKARRERQGLPASQHDFLQQVMHEPGKRRHILTVYAAALWRLMEESDGS